MIQNLILTTAICLATGLAACGPQTVMTAEADTNATVIEENGRFVSLARRTAFRKDAPHVVFIPGLASSADVWDGTREALGDSANTHVVQVAGFGTPAADNQPNSLIDGIVSGLADQLIGMNISDSVVVGHSLGGVVALELARTHPGIVSRVVVIDALPYFPALFLPDATPADFGPQADAMIAQMRSLNDTAYAAMQTQGVSIQSKTDSARTRITRDLLASDRGLVISAMEELMGRDVRPTLSDITQPVTVIHAYDPAMGRTEDDMRTLFTSQYAGLRDVDIITVPDSFHFVMDDQPDVFLTHLRTILESEI